MLIPQFTIRTIIVLTIGAAIAAWVANRAFGGAPWGAAVMATFFFAAVLLGGHMLAFVISQRFAAVQNLVTGPQPDAEYVPPTPPVSE